MKCCRRVIALVLCLLAVMYLNRGNVVMAAGMDELKQQWYETRNYPVNPDSEEWKKYGISEMFNILNPPQELLETFSTEELAKLMMEYPYLWVLTTYEADKLDYFWGFVEGGCDIYNELLKREDGVLCLLTEYRNTDFDVELYNADPYMVWGYHPMANAEVFGCQFINTMEMHLAKRNTNCVVK